VRGDTVIGPTRFHHQVCCLRYNTPFLYCRVIHPVAGPIFWRAVNTLVSHNNFFLSTTYSVFVVFIEPHILFEMEEDGVDQIQSTIPSLTIWSLKSKVAKKTYPRQLTLLSSRHRLCSMRLQCFQGCVSETSTNGTELHHHVSNLRRTPHQVHQWSSAALRACNWRRFCSWCFQSRF
jgi:hypothetical protein